MPPALIMVSWMMALRGSGDAMTPLWFMILAVLLDSGLNPVFILGLGPAPRLGIAGAATATVIANFISLAALLAYVYRRDLPLRLRGAELRYLIPDRALLGTIVRKGLPMGLQMIVISASALALIGLVNREGVETTAAFGVAMQLWTYLQMPAMALGAAVSAMVAQNIGAGRWDRVERDHPLGGDLRRVDHRRPGRAARPRRPAGPRPLPRRRQPGASDRPPHPAPRHLELPSVRSDPRPVRHGAGERRGDRAADHPVRRPGADPARLRARRLSLARRRRPVAELPGRLVRQHGDGHRLLSPRRLAEEPDAGPPPGTDECIEEALAAAEPGGRLNPTG